MFPDSLLKARYKRHFAKHSFTFHYIVPPGWENEAFHELKRWVTLEESYIDYGGISFKHNLNCIPVIHSRVRIGIRLLMRLAEFTCLSYAQLKKRTLMIPFELHLGFPETIRLKCQSKSSWLYSEKALFDRTAELLVDYYQSLDHKIKVLEYAPDQPGVTLYVMLKHNRMYLSLDLTGNPLYKRGITPYKSKAPLRENIAAAALNLIPRRDFRLIYDPFCGSGTLLMEAYHHYTGYPQLQRHYDYQTLPMRWFVDPVPDEPSAPVSPPLFIGQDRDWKALSVFRHNLEHTPDHPRISMILADSLCCQPHPIPQPVLILANPPYGRRLLNRQQAERLVEQWIDLSFNHFPDLTLGVFFPPYEGLKKKAWQIRAFPYGGLDLCFYVFKNWKS